MGSRIAVRAVGVALLLSVLTAPSFSFDGQRTDAQAGCVYGTRAVQPSDYPSAGQFKTYQAFREYYNARKECDVSWQWFPGARGFGISYVVAGPATTFGYASSPSDPPATRVQVLCNGFDDPRCAASNFAQFPGGGQLRADATTYHCASDADFNCVSSIEVIAPDGSVQQARFLQHFPDGPKVAGAKWTTKYADGRTEQNSASPGGSPALWSYETPEGPRLVVSLGMLEQAWDAQSTMDSWGREHQNMYFSLFPVETGTAWNTLRMVAEEWTETDPNGLTHTKAGPRMPRESKARPADFVEGGAQCGGFASILSDDRACLVETTFPAGYRYRVSIQLEDYAGFSFMARLDAPVAYSAPIPDGHRYVIEAAPSESYLVTASVPKAAMSPEFIAAVQKTDMYDAYRWGLNPVDNPPMENRLPDFIAALAPYIGDMSQFKYPAWSFYSVPVGNGGMSATCRDQLKGQVVSITSTNATAYDRNGPTFDQATRTFTFKAAAPHFEPDGKTLAVGHYYMNMNARFTQCVLGTDKVPDQATVALDYATGDVNVATVAVHTDKDWLRLTADNFHYSSPQIRVQFPKPAATLTPTPTPTQSATPTPTVTPVATTPASTPAKPRATITCVKGKQSRKVTAVNPKCPSGWKRK